MSNPAQILENTANFAILAFVVGVGSGLFIAALVWLLRLKRKGE
jgi:hypothetical protein